MLANQILTPSRGVEYVSSRERQGAVAKSLGSRGAAIEDQPALGRTFLPPTPRAGPLVLFMRGLGGARRYHNDASHYWAVRGGSFKHFIDRHPPPGHGGFGVGGFAAAKDDGRGWGVASIRLDNVVG